MPRRNRRARRKSRVQHVEPPRDLSTEQMAARLVSKGLASPMILNFHRWRTAEMEPTQTDNKLSAAVRGGADRRNDR